MKIEANTYVVTISFMVKNFILSTIQLLLLIYLISCKNCGSQYAGKTTQTFKARTKQHFQKGSKSALTGHAENCTASTFKDFILSYLEKLTARGKYSLSEREYLWNSRLKCAINIQKTLVDQIFQLQIAIDIQIQDEYLDILNSRWKQDSAHVASTKIFKNVQRGFYSLHNAKSLSD